MQQTAKVRNWVLLFLAFTLIGLIFSVLVHGEDMSRYGISYGTALFYELTGTWGVFALIPVFLPIVKRFMFRLDNWKAMLVLHLALSLVYGALHTSIMVLIRFWALGSLYYSEDLYQIYLYEFHKQLLAYSTFLIVVHAQKIYREKREQEQEKAALELKTSRLQGQLAQSQLEALKSQLHPHFLFNTLNAISSLMYEDVARADKMIADLSRLLRSVLDSSGHQLASLRKEISFLELYLEIMQGRYEENLITHVTVAPEAWEAQVPNLILQPLVENAIKHMEIHPESPARIEVTARRRDQQLVLEINDNGPGLDAEPEACMKRGMGLANTKARLETLYPRKHQFLLENRDDGGLKIVICLPFEEKA